MTAGRTRPSLGSIVANLVAAGLLVWTLINGLSMSRRGWIRYVVVTSGPVEQNVRLDSDRLRYRFRRVAPGATPFTAIADAQGQFVTRSGADESRKQGAELVLLREHLAPRPEIDGGVEVFTAGIAAPWRITDFHIGDDVYAVAGASRPVPARQQSDGAARARGGTLLNVPAPAGASPRDATATPREGDDTARTTDAARTTATDVRVWKMTVVAIGGPAASGLLYLSPADAASADAIRKLPANSLTIASVSPRKRPDTASPGAQR